MIKRMFSTDADKITVRFELPPAIQADTAHLVGEFNDWNETSHPMTRDNHNNTWHITIELERGKAYQFRYLVNGREWHNDWDADKYEPNPFGGTNSVVIV